MNPTEDGQPGAAKDDFYRDYVNSEDNEILVDIADEERVRRTLLGLGIHEDTARSRTSPNLRLTLFAFEEPSGESRRVLNLIQGARCRRSAAIAWSGMLTAPTET
jgi:hypothetical protein